ncbi:MAG: sigma-54-dependent Fis family transcriptional regulator [Deltaproteobacteria bacterium]|nr:sigma-54-dependent Fis family transcriptional regulator [Deltaproteobacteria bacterium]
MAATILIVDDEKNIRRTLRMVLEEQGHAVIDAATAENALSILASEDIDLVILDVRLPGISGLELLERTRQKPTLESLPVIMISGHASVAEAVHAVQLGATDFFEKPLDRDRVLVSVTSALRSGKLRRELNRLRAQVEERYEMTGQSEKMKELYTAIEKVAPTKTRVLITGESGTGKELVARAIHRLSQRCSAPFIMLNCAAIPTELIESELFGYERGAFTGATSRKKGMFELADGGTLLLDEIGDMSADAQAKVLRALQSGKINRVGSESDISVDVRVIAATNKDLEAEVAKGNFREDLYYRLNVVPIRSPALRERVDDIPALAKVFLRECCRDNGVREKPIDDAVLEALQRMPWPGNVRELRNVIERMVILSGDRITKNDLPLHYRQVQNAPKVERPLEEIGISNGLSDLLQPSEHPTLREFRDRAERDYILSILNACDWNISRASGILGIERTNLHKKMRSLDIKRDRGVET